jgi:hypothetical protein
MTYTFTEEEIRRFYDWAGVYDFELGLNDADKLLVKKLGQVLQKPFEDMTNEEKVQQFLQDNDYPMATTSPAGETNWYWLLQKEGKEDKLIDTNTDFITAIKEIVNYYED